MIARRRPAQRPLAKFIPVTLCGTLKALVVTDIIKYFQCGFLNEIVLLLGEILFELSFTFGVQCFARPGFLSWKHHQPPIIQRQILEILEVMR
jgi:hypothetical protein